MATYREPDWFITRIANPMVALLAKAGVSLRGSRILEVRGRRSGRWHSTPVNPLEFQGDTYLVAPRGETQWARNVRTAGEGRLRLGRNVERFRATELSNEVKPPVLRAYLGRWQREAGTFFEGLGPSAPDADLLRIASNHPVFRIEKIG
jgi:deazaflavin-dependent oxidoreductase (nitroreductase family)